MTRALATHSSANPGVFYVRGSWGALLVVVTLLTWLCIPSHRTLGRRLLESGDPAHARGEMLVALERAPEPRERAAIHEDLAHIALLGGDVAAARGHREKAAQLAPDSIRALVNLSELDDMEGQLRRAMVRLERAHELEREWRRAGRPRTPELGCEVEERSGVTAPAELRRAHQEWYAPHLRRLAFYERWFQRLEPALAVHRELVEDEPGNLIALGELFRLESCAGNRDRARAVLERMVTLRPDDSSLRDRLSHRYTWARRPELAAEQLSRAKLPIDETRRRVLGSFVQSGRPDDALAEYRRRLPNDTDARGIQLAFAEVLLDNEDLARARTVLTALERTDPRDPGVLLPLAELRARTRDHRGAARAYLELSAGQPREDRYLRAAIDELGSAGDRAGAVRAIAELLRRHPGDPAVRREAGIKFAQVGAYREARPLLEEQFARDPDDEATLFHLAGARAELGRPAAGVVLYERLLAMLAAPHTAAGAGRVGAGALDQATGRVRRKVLAFYKRADGEFEDRNRVHALLELVLNHLGLVVDFRAAEDPPPTEAEMAPYRGVITWFSSDRLRGAEAFTRWLAVQPGRGRALILLETLGATVDQDGLTVPPDALQALYDALGVSAKGVDCDDPARIAVAYQDPGLVGFERPLAYENEVFAGVRSVGPDNRVALSLALKDVPGSRCDAVITGPWGAFVMPSYALYEDSETHKRGWRVDPFRLMREALHLDGLPRLDFTTRTGRRLAYIHLDGDGADEVCEWDPVRSCARVFREEFVERLGLPMTVSFIAGPLDRSGPGSSDVADARALFANPLVEPAHHTFSHPFHWPGERALRPEWAREVLDPDKEIVGARDVLERLICPPGKPVVLCTWSGSSCPDLRTLVLCRRAGLLNLNGGVARFDGNYPSVAHLEPLHRTVDGLVQNLTSMANDYVITEDETLPPIAFANVIETFRRTGEPRRLLPVNLYFHFYMLASCGGYRALEQAFDWLARQPLHAVLASEFIRCTVGFRSGEITRAADGAYEVRGTGRCLTVRFDSDENVDLNRSAGVLGFVREGGALYVHLDPTASASRIRLGPAAARRPYLESSTAEVAGMSAGAENVSLRIGGTRSETIVLAGLPAGVLVPVRIGGASAPPLSADALGRVTLEAKLDTSTTIEFGPWRAAP